MDPGDLATTAEVDGEWVVVSGRKTLVQDGADVDYFLVTGKTGSRLTLPAPSNASVSCLLVSWDEGIPSGDEIAAELEKFLRAEE